MVMTLPLAAAPTAEPVNDEEGEKAVAPTRRVEIKAVVFIFHLL